MAETLEQLIVDINANTKGFEKGLDQVEKGTKGLGVGFGKLGGIIAGAFVTTKIFDFAKATVMLASDAAELQSKFNVVFEGITDDTNEWIDTYATATARGTQETKEFLTSLQDIQTGYGRTTDEAATFSKTVVGVTNDLVSFSNVPVEQASNAIQSALAGNLEAVRSLGVSINVATIDNGEYAASINKSWKEMTILEKQNATLNEILRQSGNAVGQNVDNWQDYNFELGDAARTSTGFANQTKLLQGTLQDLGAEFGARLLPIATTFVTFLNENLVPAFDLFSNFIDVATASIVSFSKKFGETVTSTGLNLEIMKEFFLAFFEFTRQGWEIFGEDIINVATTLFEALVPIFTNLFEIIGSLVKIFTDLFKGDWEAFSDDLIELTFNLIELMKNLFKGMLSVIESVGNLIARAIVESVKSAISSVKGLLGSFIDLGEALIDSMIDGIINASKNLAKKAVEAVKNALKAAREFVSGGTGRVTGITGRAEASAGGGGGGTRGLSSPPASSGIPSTRSSVTNVTINNNNNPSPSDIARQINKQSVAMGLNF